MLTATRVHPGCQGAIKKKDELDPHLLIWNDMHHLLFAKKNWFLKTQIDDLINAIKVPIYLVKSIFVVKYRKD